MSDSKIYISQKEAIRQFKAAGYTGEAQRAAVGELRKFRLNENDKREKVKIADVRRVIREASEPTPFVPAHKPIRPIKWRPGVLEI